MNCPELVLVGLFGVLGGAICWTLCSMFGLVGLIMIAIAVLSFITGWEASLFMSED